MAGSDSDERNSGGLVEGKLLDASLGVRGLLDY